jgi:hypothetical protein
MRRPSSLVHGHASACHSDWLLIVPGWGLSSMCCWGCERYKSGLTEPGDERSISLRELDRTATMMSIMARPALFEADYLMATALTSLNVVWPSRTF